MKRNLILTLFISVSIGLFAQPFQFVFENNTSETISEFYCESPEEGWSDNFIDGFVLYPGESMEVVYNSPYPGCEFNLMAYSENGNTYRGTSDLCNNDYIVFNDLFLEGNDEGDYYEYNEYAEEEYDQGGGVIDGDIKDVITYNKWEIYVQGKFYGTLKLDPDGDCVKTQAGMNEEVIGTWAMNGNNLLLYFPSEGPSFEGPLNYINGSQMEVSFYDGVIVWSLIAENIDY